MFARSKECVPAHASLPWEELDDMLPSSEEVTALALAGDFRPMLGEHRALMILLLPLPMFAA